ncbi:cupin-like domain-containing protein [Alteromonas aestuariivivens]|uniref:Cupin-like domain-containing protein n=1 Tax=Alteromonas aestuariivivens TaxID=1938339 RepID=A0A3D8MAS6_9ALTE|nr:cupin-like domain-containing protein [Alteromonas aestuariivivens]RDV26798.1 cupin-like domain-containing protein [Alteromonas aestuariivivens]
MPQFPEIKPDTPAGLTQLLESWTTPTFLPQLVGEWPLVKAARQSDQALVDYLLGFDKGISVDCLRLPHAEQGRVFYNSTFDGFNFERQRLPFQTALQQLLTLRQTPEPESLYVGSTSVERCLPGMLQQNPMPLDALNPLATLWIGNKSRIAAHYDMPDNLICVTAGKRKVTLFPPDQVENLYVGPLHFTPAGQAISLVDLANPDFEQFPRFRLALEAAMVFELTPGDALYIPSMWWHHIEGQESINMLVNYWWQSQTPVTGRAENALYHTLLALGGLPDEQRQAWKALFDHYVFGQDPERFAHIPPSQRGPLEAPDEATLRQFKAMLANSLRQ